jgi:hypothetical protein
MPGRGPTAGERLPIVVASSLVRVVETFEVPVILLLRAWVEADLPGTEPMPVDVARQALEGRSGDLTEDTRGVLRLEQGVTQLDLLLACTDDKVG